MNKSLAYLQYWLDFLLGLTEKEIKVRYKQALLGFMWVVINPLLQMVVIGFVFQFFVPVEVDNYYLFLFAGLMPWNFFSLSLSKTTPSIVFERSLIQKSKFPREAIVLSIVLSNLFHLTISLFLFYVVLLLLGFSLSWGWLFSLSALVWLTLLTSGLSLLFSALDVKYRDVNFVVQAIMPLWLYITPVVYTLDVIPAWLHPVFYVNPMTGVIELFRYFILHIPITSSSLLMYSLGSSLVLFILGVITFKKESPFFDDWL